MDKSASSTASLRWGACRWTSSRRSWLLVSLIVSAFPLFLYLRGRAAAVAKEAADQQLKDAGEKMEAAAIARMEAMLPALVADYVKLAQVSVVSGEDADKIAAAQEDAGDDGLGGDKPVTAKSTGGRPRSRGRSRSWVHSAWLPRVLGELVRCPAGSSRSMLQASIRD